MNHLRGLALAAGVALAVVGVSGFRAKSDVAEGSKAPDFSVKGTDGKTHTLKSLTDKGPLVLYFIKIGCPVNHRAAPFYEKIVDAYGEKANFVGVINGDEAEAKKWLKEYKSDMVILPDPDKKLIKGYGVDFSPWAVSVESGKITNIWAGGSPKNLSEVNAMVAKGAGASAAKLSFEGAPAGGG